MVKRSLIVLVVLMLLVTACIPILPSSETYRVAFLLADSPTDRGWNAAHYRGIKELQKLGKVVEAKNLSFTVRLANGDMLEVLVIENVGYNEIDIDRVVNGAINEGYNMIWGTWWDAQNAIYNAAEKHPEVLFEHCSSYPFKENNGTNFSTYFIRQEEGDYVAGCVAGLMGIEKVGFVGTHSIPEPVRGLNAFALGLQQCGSADAEVRLVWLNSWLDVEGEVLAAEGLIAEGFTTIRQMADTPYSSEVACEAGGVAIGYGTDVSPTAPCAIVSNTWDWGPYYVTEVIKAMNGEWIAQDYWEGFSEDVVIMEGWNVPDVVRQKAGAVVTQIINGYNTFCGPISGTGLGTDGELIEIQVPAGKCLSDMDLLTMQWFVDGVSGQYPSAPPDGFDLELVDE